MLRTTKTRLLFSWRQGKAEESFLPVHYDCFDFLRFREGSYEASKALLDNFANREITDHMDRLPRDVASERLHHDIVRLLDEHIARSPQMATIISSGPLIGKMAGKMGVARGAGG